MTHAIALPSERKAGHFHAIMFGSFVGGGMGMIFGNITVVPARQRGLNDF